VHLISMRAYFMARASRPRSHGAGRCRRRMTVSRIEDSSPLCGRDHPGSWMIFVVGVIHAGGFHERLFPAKVALYLRGLGFTVRDRFLDGVHRKAILLSDEFH